MNSKKTFFVEGTQLVTIDGHEYIPSVLCYNKKHQYDWGHNAISRLSNEDFVNANFKIELGRYTPQKITTHRHYPTNIDGVQKTAYELTDDYFKAILKNVEGAASTVFHEKEGLKVIISEPLSFYTEDNNWIRQYRKNIRNILHAYKDVDFLPEPFAVYQYYRYGLKHPAMQEAEKQVALIIDFGGGTFDVSIIESTNKGDISIKGKHSKPLAASSCPVGGYYVNSALSKYLILKSLEECPKDSRQAKTFFKALERMHKNGLKLEDLAKDKRAFVRNYNKLEHIVEQSKIELSSKITEWALDAEGYEKVTVPIPVDPFNADTQWASIDIYGHEFKKIFITDIWNAKIKMVVKEALSRAKGELDEKKITRTLISGGSSNIRWLGKLIDKDFKKDLSNSIPISISNSFQEVVAKGLAIECARRHYDSESEFVSVTYNPVKLLLDPDTKGIELRSFSSVKNAIDMTRAKEGDLLPSAQDLQHFIDTPVQWKVRLNHGPRHSLSYYFTKQFDCEISEIKDQHNCLYNIDNIVYTPKQSAFDKKIKVEITVKKDGTAYPRFIYKSGNEDAGVKGSTINAAPFMLDVTTANQNTNSNRYIGFDFGTSNSSISYITNEQIQIITKRSQDPGWLQLKDLLQHLPILVSLPLKQYLSEADSERAAKNAREVFEQALSLLAYTSASELILNNRFKPNTIGESFKRSMGPLKHLIYQANRTLKKKALFTKKLHEQLVKNEDIINKAIDDFNAHKHDKLSSEDFPHHEYLIVITNILHKVLKGKIFGQFDDVQKKPFSSGAYKGTFRCAHDSRTFYNRFEYEGLFDANPQESYLVDLESNTALPLSPFIIFKPSRDCVDCLVFDKKEGSSFIYKSSTSNKAIQYDSSTPLYTFMKTVLEGIHIIEERKVDALINIQT